MQKIDSLIIIIVIFLMIIGAIFSYSLPLFLEISKGWSFYYFLYRYLIFAVVGIGIMYGLSKLDPDKAFDKIGWLIFFSSMFLLIILPILPSSIAPSIKGSHRWIHLGIVNIAPVEFFKIGIIFFLAWSFSRKVGNMNLKQELIQISYYIAFLGFFWLFIIIYQSDLGQVIVMFTIFAAMLFIAGGKLQTIGIIFFSGGILFSLAILIAPYRFKRIKLWLIRMHELFFKDSTNITSISHTQLQQSLNSIYHGGILGKGIGNGVFKLGFLSDVHTDFVLAGIAEETGIIGISIIIILISALLYRIFRIAFRVENKKYQLFVFGIGSLIGIEFLFNALGITGMLPLKGLAVPFISYGGSSLISLSIGIGMVLMISKKVKL